MKKKVIILTIIMAMILPNMVWANSPVLEDLNKAEADIILFTETLQYIEDNYPFEIHKKDLIEAALKGMLKSVDPYSDYYTKEQAEEIYGDIMGVFSGIGVYMEKAEEYIRVKDLIKDNAGEKSGLKKADLIIAVDDLDIKGMDLEQVSRKIRGEIGSKVKLTIKRGDKVIDINIIREKIKINPVEFEVLEGKIGYILLKEFNGNSTDEIEKALKHFDSKGIKKLILDLRDNPGGQLKQAINISRLFIPKGPIVHIREKNKDLVSYISTLEKPKYKLIVLTNRNSASAAEILAGAVKDRKAGILLGQKTYGKGLVQNLIPIKSGGMIKITTAEYLTANKISINEKGIKPHIIVENTNFDLQLERALEILKNK